MSAQRQKFVPALGFDALTPLYDAALALTMRERAFKQRLIERAALRPGQRVLDFGCGTGTLSLAIKSAFPDADVVGLDLDPRILQIAQRKAVLAGVAIDWIEGSVVEPPLTEGRFDRVVSSLVFHHLTSAEKRAALAAARRLLRPGGALHIADFGKPHSAFTRVAAAAFRYFDGVERTADNLAGRLPQLAREAGFVDVDEAEPWTTMFGTLRFVAGRVPA